MPTLQNKINGAFTYLEFLVTTTGGLSEGDKIVVKLPFGWQFSRDSEVLGLTSTLKNVMDDVTISVDQR